MWQSKLFRIIPFRNNVERDFLASHETIKSVLHQVFTPSCILSLIGDEMISKLMIELGIHYYIGAVNSTAQM